MSKEVRLEVEDHNNTTLTVMPSGDGVLIELSTDEESVAIELDLAHLGLLVSVLDHIGHDVGKDLTEVDG